MKLTRAVLVVALMAGGFVVTSAAPASACPSGSVCYWGEDVYTGCYFWDSSSDTNLSNDNWINCSIYSVNQGANSVQNRGNVCTIIFFDFTNYNGGNHWMSRIGLGGYWFDSNLGNNNWTSGSGTVENDITSHKFCA